MGYEVVWEQPAGVIKRHFGLVTGRDLLGAVRETEGDSRFDTLRYVINDFRDCTGLAVSPAEVQEIAALDGAAARTNPRIRIAVVTDLPEVMATAKAYADDPLTPFVTRVFASMEEARRWVREGAS